MRDVAQYRESVVCVEQKAVCFCCVSVRCTSKEGVESFWSDSVETSVEGRVVLSFLSLKRGVRGVYIG